VQGAIFFVTMIPLAVTFLYVSEQLRGGVWAAVAIHFAGNVALTFAPAPSLAGTALVLAIATLVAVVILLRPRSGPQRPARLIPRLATAIGVLTARRWARTTAL
jgi:hypothetical protein